MYSSKFLKRLPIHTREPLCLHTSANTHPSTIYSRKIPKPLTPGVKYHPKIYTHILRCVKDTEIAKELTQETWIKAFRAINTFRADASFYSWLYRIAENVCIDYYRRQKVARIIEPIHDIDERRIIDTHPCPSHNIERQELRHHLQEAVACLTPTRKRVFLLYYVHEMPIKDIATRMKRSEGTIKTHLRNARLHLRERLTPYLKNQHIPWLA